MFLPTEVSPPESAAEAPGALAARLLGYPASCRRCPRGRFPRPPRFRVLCLLALLSSAPAAADWLLALDPAATEIRFTLGATLHKVHGTVTLTSGELRVDPASGKLEGQLIIDATSAATGHEGRDRDMHRKVLESGRFGRFVLEARRLEGELDLAGTSRVVIHGDLRIHGGSHPVTMPAEVTVDGERVTATATLEVPYVAWGLKNPSKLLLRVSKSVQVDITVAGTLTPAS